MDEIHKLYKKIQMYFMKKNQECDELQYLCSRATTENINHIDDICQTMVSILDSNNILMKEKTLIDNERCVQLYMYLLLNTKFKNQERLAEDLSIGHLVDMFPSLSPYLFVQILWNLEYDKILIESLLYLPFELCTEIIEIVRKCMEELPFRRAIDNTFQVILNLYTKFIRSKEVPIQSKNPEQSIQDFLIAFEEFLLLLMNPKITCRPGIPKLKKSEHCGIIFKKLISTVKNCLELKTKEASASNNLERLYSVTLGRGDVVKCDIALVEDSIAILNQKLMDLLVAKVKEVDCKTYMDWVEVDDEINDMISLQRSVGNECYYFLEFIQSDEQLSQNIDLTECLKQLSSKPDPKRSSFVLSIQELRSGISEGRKELMKELLCRYKEWDQSVLRFVYENATLLDKKDCLSLLNYLTFIFTQPNENNFKEHCYTTITKIISLRSVPDIYEIVIAYIVKHDGKNYLDSRYTKQTFIDFIARNQCMQRPMNLKIVLFFLLKNFRLILTSLVKITIGYPQYKNILVSATDMLLLSPFMEIIEDNGKKVLTNILKTICVEDVEWNGKKFIDFIRMVTDKSIIGEHDLINDVFVPCLERNTSNVSNINSVLYNIRMLQDGDNKHINIKQLLIALATKMSFLRKTTNTSKYASSEVISRITRLLECFLGAKGYRISMCTKDEIIEAIETIIEPIDRLHFAPLWYLARKGIGVMDVIEDYEKRCAVLNRLKEDPKTSEALRNYLSRVNLLRADFLRHLITRSTEEEYHRIGSELTVIYWFAFGCSNEFKAFDLFLRLTMDACCLSLEYPSVGGNNLFVFLLKSFVQFCKKFSVLQGVRHPDRICQSLIENLNQIDGSVKRSPCAHLFATCLASLNSNAQQDSTSDLQDVLTALSRFCDQCLELNGEYGEEITEIPRSPKITEFYVTHEIISACVKVQTTEPCKCLRKLNELFVPNQYFCNTSKQEQK